MEAVGLCDSGILKWAIVPIFFIGGGMAARLDVLRELVEPVVQSLGYVLWGIDSITQGRRSVVRIYIDAEEGVNVDDCARVSRQVASIFDVEDPIAGEYTLEVSSPGMDRPLYSCDQFQAYVGHLVSVKLRIPFEGRRKFSGRLNAIEGDDIVVAIDDEEYLLPFGMIDKANVVPEF